MEHKEGKELKEPFTGPPLLWCIGFLFGLAALVFLVKGAFLAAVAFGSVGLTLFTISDTRERITRIERHLDLHKKEDGTDDEIPTSGEDA